MKVELRGELKDHQEALVLKPWRLHVDCTSSGALVVRIPGTCWSAIHMTVPCYICHYWGIRETFAHRQPLKIVGFKALREKERGDWRRLCLDEKKTLYRASFCQTFAEMDEPRSEWKSILGFTLVGISAGFWLWIYCHIFVHRDAPITFSEEHRGALYWRLKAIMHQPMTGIYKPPFADKYKPETMPED